MTRNFQVLLLLVIACLLKISIADRSRSLFCLSLSTITPPTKKQDTRTNIGHDKSNKIKVAPKDNMKVVSNNNNNNEEEKEEEVIDEKDVIQKQQSRNNIQQMVISVGTMILSRMIFKLDFK